MNHIHHVFCTPIMPSIHKRPKGFRVDSKEIPSHRFLEVMQSKWRKREGDSCGIHSGSKKLLSSYKQGGDTFPSVGNLYFSLEGSVSTLAPHQLHLFWQVWSCTQSHLRAVKTSTAVQRASLLQQLGVCVCGGGRPVHYSVGAVTLTVSVLREIRKYTSPRLTNSKATCIFVHNPWQIWWIIWCRVMMPAASLFLLLALNRLNCNRHKERLVANNPWPQLLWIYADQ